MATRLTFVRMVKSFSCIFKNLGQFTAEPADERIRTYIISETCYNMFWVYFFSPLNSH